MTGTKAETRDNFKKGTVDGQKAWLIVMVFIFMSYQLFENLTRYGLVMGPFDILFLVIRLITEHISLVYVAIIYYVIQIFQAYGIEKLLAKGSIKENLGMKLHILNTFYTFTLFLVTVVKIIARIMLTYIVYTGTKVWSYAYINSLYRKALHSERNAKYVKSKELKVSSSNYPNNVNIRNLLSYFIFTPPIEYHCVYSNRTKPDIITFIKCCCSLVLVFCGVTFIIFQFMLPEMQTLQSSKREPSDFVGIVLRLILPVHLGWLLYSYANTYKCYLAGYAALTGMGETKFNGDWWNSQDINEFWRRWNMPVHTALRCNVFKPLLKNGFSKWQAQIITVAVAGIIHEYLNTIPFGVYNGSAFIATMAEIPLGIFTEYIHKKFGAFYGNILLWMYLFFIHVYGVIGLGLRFDLNSEISQ